MKPGFYRHEECGVSAFEGLNEQSFAGKWKIIHFYPKDFPFVYPTEVVGFAMLAPDFADRDAVVRGGSTDIEFSKLGWRCAHKDLTSLNHRQFADSTGSLVDQFGVRDAAQRVALRATFVVNPDRSTHASRHDATPGRRGSSGRADRKSARAAAAHRRALESAR